MAAYEYRPMLRIRPQVRKMYVPSRGMCMLYLLIFCMILQAVSLQPPAYSFQNKLRFPYGINFKFNGHVYHNLERVWVVQRINIPTLSDIRKLPQLPELPDCKYASLQNNYKTKALRAMCKLTKPSMELLYKTAEYYRSQLIHLIKVELHNALYGLTPVGIIPYTKDTMTPDQILQVEKDNAGHSQSLARSLSILHRPPRNPVNMPNLPKPIRAAQHSLYLNQIHRLNPKLKQFLDSVGPSRQKRFLATLASFAGSVLTKGIGALATLAVESISAHIQKKRNKAIAKAMTKMSEKISITNQDLHALENDFLLYGKYNLNSTEQILRVLDSVDGRTTLLENWLNGSDDHWLNAYLNHYNGLAMYNHKLQLYLMAFKERYINIQERMHSELRELLKSIATLARGYLPIHLFPPSRLTSISEHAVNMIKSTHPDYVLALTHVTDYYDMPLVTFGRDEEDRLIVCFPIFLKEFHRLPLTLYQIETVKVPIHDTNTAANSYTEVQIKKPYIATNQEHYIQLVLPELRMCKQIRHTHFCEELFLIKHKSKHSCESSLFYNQSLSTINNACTFSYFYNISVMPSILDGGSHIVLANFKQRKNLVCVYDQELAKPLPTPEYSLVNRSILCHCLIQVGYTTIPQSISDCNTTALPVFYYTVNLAAWHALGNFLNMSYY